MKRDDPRREELREILRGRHGDPMSKLHRDGKAAIDVGQARARGEGYFARLRRKWRPEDTRLAVAASGGAVVALTLAAVASKLFGGPKVATPPQGATATGAPPPPPPSKATTPSGATLTVKTPKKTPGVLRSAAGLSASTVALVPNGTVVSVTGEAVMADKPARRWYPVTVPGGRAGWMHGEILS